MIRAMKYKGFKSLCKVLVGITFCFSRVDGKPTDGYPTDFKITKAHTERHVIISELTKFLSTFFKKNICFVTKRAALPPRRDMTSRHISNP